MTDHRFEHARALACRDTLQQRCIDMYLAGDHAVEGEPGFSSQLYIYERILPFDWEFFPDFTCPWHLIAYEDCRWDHVYMLTHVIENLRQPTGSHMGEPMVLQPFQVMIILAFFGPEDPETGLRVVTEGVLTLARKQAKSSLVAALVTALMAVSPDDHGLRGEAQVGAADREQAGITYMMAERYVSMDETLGLPSRFRGVPSKKTLTHLNTLSTLRCLSSDAHRHHGGNPAIVLLDEIGNVPANLAEEFYSVLTTGFGAQEEPLTLLFSTQAPNDQHMFSQFVDKAMRLNEGLLQDQEFAGFVFTVPEKDLQGNDIDAFDAELWRMGSPGMGTIYNPKDIRTWAKKARDMPSLQNKFENLKLNRRVSETEAFLSRTAWMDNASAYDMELLHGKPCTLGIDLSETTDLCALVALFDPIEELDGRMPVLCRFFIPGNGLQERSYRDKIPYDVWSKEGFVDITSDKVVDYKLVGGAMLGMMDDFDVLAVGFDRWKWKYLKKDLEELEFSLPEEEEKEFFIEVGQGFKDQTRALEMLEKLVVESKLAHANNPVLTWNAANAVVEKDPAGNRKLTKAKSFGRIDGLVALANATFARGEFDIIGDGPSLYNDESRDVIM